jgi:predicted DNA-binding transcriptional regulator YafY
MTGGYHETELNYMVHYLTSFGKHLVVEEPLQLKEAYVKHLKDMLSLME